MVATIISYPVLCRLVKQTTSWTNKKESLTWEQNNTQQVPTPIVLHIWPLQTLSLRTILSNIGSTTVMTTLIDDEGS
jgi:hypothetical protein